MSNKTVVKELVEYFEQQLSLQRKSEIKYTTEEALVDAIQVCNNALKTKERTQIINAFNEGCLDTYKKGPINGGGAKYYNNTFKND